MGLKGADDNRLLSVSAKVDAQILEGVMMGRVDYSFSVFLQYVHDGFWEWGKRFRSVTKEPLRF
jgi:hypothetical protein